MPAKMHYRAGGVWREMKSGTAVRFGGAWRELKAAWVRVGGVWQKVFQAFAVTWAGASVSDGGLQFGYASAQYLFNADGSTSVWVSNGTSGAGANWGTPTTSGAGANYWIRATLSSGSTPSGSALNTWHQLNAQRGWLVERNSTIGTTSCTLSVSIATDSAGTNIVATADLSLGASLTV